MYLEGQLVNFTSVAEAYHRVFLDAVAVAPERHEELTTQMLEAIENATEAALYARKLRFANEVAQEERILGVIRRAGKVVEPLGNKAGRLSNKLATTRNYLVHLPGERPDVLEGPAMHEAIQLLILALQCNLLLDIGLDPERAGALVASSYSQEFLWRDLHQRQAAWPK
jgi:hypothetical protein